MVSKGDSADRKLFLYETAIVVYSKESLTSNERRRSALSIDGRRFADRIIGAIGVPDGRGTHPPWQVQLAVDPAVRDWVMGRHRHYAEYQQFDWAAVVFGNGLFSVDRDR